MSGGATLDLARATTVEVAEFFRRGGRTALLPLGSTEAHGPHLPLATDVVIAVELARRSGAALAARGIEAALLPPLSYAVTEFVGSFPGTLSVPAAAVAGLIDEIAAACFRQGYRVLALINGHLEPEHARMLKDAAARITAAGAGVAVFPDYRRLPVGAELGEEFGRGGGHGGGYETSLVLAAEPSLVRDPVRARLAPNFVDIAERLRGGARTAVEAGGPEAYFGDPAGASAAEGERLYGVLAPFVAEAVAAALAGAARGT